MGNWEGWEGDEGSGRKVGLSIWKEVLRIWVDVRKIAILVNSAD